MWEVVYIVETELFVFENFFFFRIKKWPNSTALKRFIHTLTHGIYVICDFRVWILIHWDFYSAEWRKNTSCAHHSVFKCQVLSKHHLLTPNRFGHLQLPHSWAGLGTQAVSGFTCTHGCWGWNHYNSKSSLKCLLIMPVFISLKWKQTSFKRNWNIVQRKQEEEHFYFSWQIGVAMGSYLRSGMSKIQP